MKASSIHQKFSGHKFNLTSSGLPYLSFVSNNINEADKQHTIIKDIQKDVMLVHDQAMDIFRLYNSDGNHEQWEQSLSEIKEALLSVIELFQSAMQKMVNKSTSDHSGLWEAIDSRINKLKKALKKLMVIGKEQLSDKDFVKLSFDISHVENNLVPVICSFSGLCKIELSMTEKYTSEQLKPFFQLVKRYIPDHFDLKNVQKYESEYIKAIQNLHLAVKDEVMIRHTFFSLLVGSALHSPDESRMMRNFLDKVNSI